MTNSFSRSQERLQKSSNNGIVSDIHQKNSLRFALMDKLRRLLFKPLVIAPIVIAFAALSVGSVMAEEIVFDPTKNQTIGEGNYMILDTPIINEADWGNSIALDGGVLQINKSATALWAEGNTIYQPEFGSPVNVNYVNPGGEAAFKKYYIEERMKLQYGTGEGQYNQINEMSTHQIDLTNGGTILIPDFATFGITPPDPTSGSYNVGDLTILGTGNTTIARPITMDIDKEGRWYNTFEGNIKFTGKLNLGQFSMTNGFEPGGTLNIFGNAEYMDAVTLYGTYSGSTQMLAGFGVQNFQKEVVVYQSMLLLDARQNESSTFEDDVTINGGRLYSWGNINYKGDVIIDTASVGVFAESYNGVGTNTFSPDSTLIIKNTGNVFGGYVYGGAQHLNVNTTLIDGNISYYNIDRSKQESGINNELFYTYDENMTPTVLQWEAGAKNIKDAIDGGRVLNKNLTGYGTVYFGTVGKYIENVDVKANGYTVVIDNTAENSDGTVSKSKKQFYGATYVDSAMMVLKGDTLYGVVNPNNPSSSQFYVSGESYTKAKTTDSQGNIVDAWKVNSCGILGFYRGDNTNADTAPTLNAYTVEFADGIIGDTSEGARNVIGGARIWIDANYADGTKDHKLGAINAAGIGFGDKTAIWYDGISTQKSDTNMTFNLNAVVIDTGDRTVEDIFGGELIKASFKDKVVTVNARDVAEYASAEGMSNKEIEYAQKLDVNRLSPNSDVAFNDALYNERDPNKVRQTIHNLSLLGFNMANRFNHFGNPTSSFFGGSSMSGVAKRGQSMEESVNSTKVQTDNLSQSVFANESNAAGMGYNGNDMSRQVWASFSHTSVNGYDYNNGGMKMSGYDLRRSGVMGGIRKQFSDTFSGGLFFAYSTPQVTSSGLFEGANGSFYSKMEMEDFQYALHFEKILLENWEMAVYVGGGTQTMDWQRHTALDTSGLYSFGADGSGTTFTATAYLSRRIDMTDQWTLRPTIGIDSEHSWLYQFAENQTNANAADPGVYMKMFTEAYTYDKTTYHRNTARVGLTSSYQGPQGYGGLTGRIFYGVQLGGDPAPMVSCWSQSYNWEDMDTHEMGGESLNLGAGGYWYLNPCKTLTLTADINGLWYENATTQNVTAGLSYRY